MRNTKINTHDDSVRGHVRVRQFILLCVRGRSASAKNLADGRQSADTVRVRTTLTHNHCSNLIYVAFGARIPYTMTKRGNMNPYTIP